jgi:polysaccharide pyruvyl transferase CsaB
MENIVISGYFGFNNTGDEALLNSTIIEIKNNLTDCNICVISHDVARTKQIHNVNAVDRMDFNAISDVISISDLVILGGGGLFQDHHKMNIADLFSQSGYGTVSYAIVPLIAKMHNKPVFYFAQGIGPLFSRESRSFVHFASQLADFITVRDLESEVLLKELCISDDKILLTADPAIKLKLASEESVNRIFIKETIPFSDNYVCVSVRSWIDKSIEDSYKKAIAKALDKFVEQKNIYFLFVPFQIHEYGDDDYVVSKEIIEMMKNKSKCYVLENVYDPTETAKIVSKSLFVIGMRYHSILLSINSHTPFIAISYDQKVTSLVKETGLSGYCLDFNSIDPEILLDKLESILDESSSFKSILKNTHETLVRRCEINYQILLQFTEKSAQSKFNIDIQKIVDFSRSLNFVFYQSELMYRHQKEYNHGIEEKDNEIHELQNIVADFKLRLETRNEEINELQKNDFNIRNQLNGKNKKISQLEEIIDVSCREKDRIVNNHELYANSLKEELDRIHSLKSWKLASRCANYYSNVMSNLKVAKNICTSTGRKNHSK